MKRFIARSFLFLFPFFLAIFFELFIWPIDRFTFRAWEALVVRKYKNFLPGPFYPNMKLRKVEEGDLAHHTPFAIKKPVQWVTDRYGFRKQDRPNERHPIVIIGESNIAGSGLSQEEMLSEVLESSLGVGVYPYAPVGINSFLREKRFKETPPRIILFAKVERELVELPSLKQKKESPWLSPLKEKVKLQPTIQRIFIYLDRISKWNMLHYVRASLRRSFTKPHQNSPEGVETPYGRLFFLQGVKMNRNIPEEAFRQAIDRIKSYHQALHQRGIRLILLPIPEKENILHEHLGIPRPTFLERFILELRSQGVETIDTQRAFEEAYRTQHLLLYHPDDTHWNADGVKVAAELVKKWIEQEGRIH